MCFSAQLPRNSAETLPAEMLLCLPCRRPLRSPAAWADCHSLLATRVCDGLAARLCFCAIPHPFTPTIPEDGRWGKGGQGWWMHSAETAGRFQLSVRHPSLLGSVLVCPIYADLLAVQALRPSPHDVGEGQAVLDALECLFRLAVVVAAACAAAALAAGGFDGVHIAVRVR